PIKHRVKTRVVDAEPIGELDLVQRFPEQTKLGAVLPRTRELMLVEDPEFHVGSSAGSRPTAAVYVGPRSNSARSITPRCSGSDQRCPPVSPPSTTSA